MSGTDEARARAIRARIAELRAHIWGRTAAERLAREGRWCGLDYVAMNEVEVLQERLAKIEGR